MTAGELVVACLQAEGIDTIFGLIGSHTYGIYDALRRQDSVQHISVCHESTATLAADAWSKVTNRTAVCILTAGPGALNSMSGVAQSQFSATPMVHITGSPPNGAMREPLHGLEREDYSVNAFAAVCKSSWRPRTLGELKLQLALAFKAAHSGRHGPVHLEIPLDLMEAPAVLMEEYSVLGREEAKCPATVAHSIATALATASKPLFCFDKGVLRSGVSRRLVQLAEQSGACMVVSRDAIGAVPDEHPLYAGVAHDFHFGTAGFEAVAQSDLTVCFGFGRDTENLQFIREKAPPGLFVFAFDDQPGAFEGGYSASLNHVASALEEAMDRQKPRLCPAWVSTRLTDQRHQLISRIKCHCDASPIHFDWALKQLRPFVDASTIVVLDAGTHEVWGRTVLPVYGPGSQIGSANWATMAYALPGMIGARLAAPGKRVIGISGDGCMLMALSDLTTWLDAGGPSVLVVLNDGEYGMIAKTQIQRYGGTHETALRPVNFAALVNSLGGTGLRVETTDQMQAALQLAFSAESPVLLDVTCLNRMDLPALDCGEA